MKNNHFPKLSKKQQKSLDADLYYLTMQELKELCAHFDLSSQGKKGFLINSLKHFLATGEQLVAPKIPQVSIGTLSELKPDALILKGSYKNDLKTRLFMKSLLGDHFHFTAYGIDWINERWLQGNPPTYQEFADEWQRVYQMPASAKRPPKKEWALINFVKRYQKQHPKASKDEVLKAWKMVSAQAAQRVRDLLMNL